MMLAAQYKMTHNLQEATIKEFNSEQISELVLGYENETILLKVFRRKFGTLVLKVVYQDESMAAETRKQLPLMIYSNCRKRITPFMASKAFFNRVGESFYNSLAPNLFPLNIKFTCPTIPMGINKSSTIQPLTVAGQFVFRKLPLQ